MKKFTDLTKQQQKMRIVKDAIAQINSGVVKAKTDHYFQMGLPIGPFVQRENAYDLQSLLKKGQKCTACAKGSLFAACVLSVDKVMTSDSIAYEPFQKKKLKKWFSVLELDMIETAFEGNVITDDTYKLSGYLGLSLRSRCVNFGKRYRSAKGRLLAILNNILKHGKFTPAE